MPARKRAKVRSSGGRKRVAKKATAAGRAESSPTSDFLIDEGLTTAQLLFVETLCADPTRPAVHAARIAYPGQAESTVYKTAHENVRNPKIIAAIRRRLDPLLHKTRTSREAVTRAIGEGMHWDPADVLAEDGTVKPMRDWPAECRRQLVSMDVDEITLGLKVVGYTKKLRFANRNDSISLGARMNKMLTDKLEHEAGPSLEALLTEMRKST